MTILKGRGLMYREQKCRNLNSLIGLRAILLCFIAILLIPYIAWSGESKHFPLAKNDPIAISGDTQYDKRILQVRTELDSVASAFQDGLRADMWVLFDENQIDWGHYFRDESLAYNFADAWTRPEESPIYDNLYRENRYMAVKFRLKLVSELGRKDKSNIDIDKTEREKEELMKEISADMYRVITWTHELFRHRIERANVSWDRYYRNSMILFQSLYKNDRQRVLKLELEFLRNRRDVISLQKNALYRLKMEPED
jgi:hypothetical protein